MPEVPKKISKHVEDDIRVLTITDLYYMLKIVNNDIASITMPKGQAVVSKKQADIVKELNKRIYGLDPYTLDTVKVYGQDPSDVLKNMEKK